MIAALQRKQDGLSVPKVLSELIAPTTPEDFLQRTFGKNFEHYPGATNKFAGLLPWSDLNEILYRHRLEPPRFRLVKSGQAIPASAFLTLGRNPRVRVPELTRQLRDGAMLILDAVDELYEPIGILNESLERTFQVPVQVNAYAGWRTSQGFDCHWDDHDVFIPQVAGRKHWRIYGVTRQFPLARDAEPAVDPPSSPLWDNLLEEGEMLYIPRGWWHEAVPLDEPTLHLTVGIHNVTGADLLSWFVDQLRSHVEVRRDVPRFETEAKRAEWMNEIGEILSQRWRPEVLEEYFRYLASTTQSRPKLSLPWSATEQGLPSSGDECNVTWALARPIAFERDGDEAIEFCCNRKRYRFAAAAAPILKQLRDRGTCSLDELHSISEGLDRQTVRAFVRELLDEGLVYISRINGTEPRP